ncbi:MAG: hypothetical protein K1060chlam1_00130 [Candidatus Anoxychlamydiales bacterium]|nr:hypothetical protein [Candidatus Anoxychlamydiales bacterium]
MNENSFSKQNNDSTQTEDLDFLKKLENLSSNEDKIKLSLEEMKKAISKENKPDFKTFWDIKNRCLVLFKTPLNATSRILFWKEYIDLSNEVKSLKNILSEQTNFEVEQIDLAINSLEADLKKYDAVLLAMKKIEINEKLKSLVYKKSFFIESQKELDLLNAFAARINSLRKETIKTQMRISAKNKFLKRFAIIGDIIFPKRKKIVDSVSEEFSISIDGFAKNFDLKKVSFFILKDAIKNLQNLAKKLTLNTEAFTNCRLTLSKCWDKVKLAEKSYKKERQKSKGFIDQALLKIENLKKMCETNPNDKDILNEEKEIFNFIKTLSLKNEDIKFLKFKINEAKAPIHQKKKKIKEKKISVEDEREKNRKTKLDQIKNDIKTLLDKSELSIDELEQEKNQIEEKLNGFDLAKFEKLILEKDFRALYHLIEEKKEKQTLNSSDELNQFLLVFEQKKKRRQTLKSHLDNLNKQLAASSLGFEKAMMLRDLIDEEKLRLKNLDKSIDQLEEKIESLESN